ncbi:hypothetical protein BDN72DRAFT_865079 [Pluteus cervinus]|uniref:Uncharacterized protein n=1 Tax=Pluteus cervinus TaxID=181527 RepID=A0ACD3A3V3_9AGAR|nr:hypothetical protein BDN72DRAFT_865079 [Pluteus cervinus]
MTRRVTSKAETLVLIRRGKEGKQTIGLGENKVSRAIFDVILPTSGIAALSAMNPRLQRVSRLGQRDGRAHFSNMRLCSRLERSIPVRAVTGQRLFEETDILKLLVGLPAEEKDSDSRTNSIVPAEHKAVEAGVGDDASSPAATLDFSSAFRARCGRSGVSNTIGVPDYIYLRKFRHDIALVTGDLSKREQLTLFTSGPTCCLGLGDQNPHEQDTTLAVYTPIQEFFCNPSHIRYTWCCKTLQVDLENPRMPFLSLNDPGGWGYTPASNSHDELAGQVATRVDYSTNCRRNGSLEYHRLLQNFCRRALGVPILSVATL